MDVIGYCFASKFALEIEDYRSAEAFRDRLSLSNLLGLVHCADRRELERIREVALDGLRAGSTALVIASTTVVAKPPGWTSPYAHFFSKSLPSGSSGTVTRHRFDTLVGAVKSMAALPPADRIRQLWTLIDPEHERELSQRFENIKRIYEYKKTGNGSPHIRERIRRVYGLDREPSWEQVQKDYGEAIRLARPFDLNTWQRERNHLSHDIFQHGFLQMISRDTVVKVLDKATSQAEIQPDIREVLASWPSIAVHFSALLDRANPEAIEDTCLLTALLIPETPYASARIQEYKARYGAQIEEHVRPVRADVERITALIDALLKPSGEFPASAGSSLQMACAALAQSLSALGRLPGTSEAA